MGVVVAAKEVDWVIVQCNMSRIHLSHKMHSTVIDHMYILGFAMCSTFVEYSHKSHYMRLEEVRWWGNGCIQAKSYV